MTDRIITVYSDYKSPYAYLAKDMVYALERDYRARIDWLPYILDIPSYLGSAKVDAGGAVLEEARNAHQWRRVRYSYMDCRRQARKQGLTIRGTQKIWNSALAASGMLLAKDRGAEVFRRYHDAVFEQFWRRALDIESVDALSAVLIAAGASGDVATDLTAGLDRVRAVSAAAEAAGVFGVTSFAIDGEIFWGREHLPDIQAMLEPRGVG